MAFRSAARLPLLFMLGALAFAEGCGGAQHENLDHIKAIARPAGRGRRHKAASNNRERVLSPEDPPDPEALKLFQARLSRPAVPLGAAASPPIITAKALEETARGEAGDMKTLGGLASAELTEGNRAVMSVRLEAGACVTFIAQGGLGVAEVDLFLTTAGGGRLLSEDRGNGPVAVVGGASGCVKNADSSAVPAELHATVRRGNGVVLVQGYQK